MKEILKYAYQKYFRPLWMEREKKYLRNKLLTLPFTKDYPYDVEAKLLRCISIKLSPMFDVGANTGFYSAVLEDIVGSDNLYIFEPLPYLHEYLKERFKNAHVFDFALSERNQRHYIRIPYINGKRFDTRATFNKHTEPNQTGHEEIEVRQLPLDEVISAIHLDSIRFIKVDVEGHELEVLNGGSETIKRFKPLLLIEIESRHHQYPVTKIFSKLEEIGYKGYYIDPKRLKLLKTDDFDADRDQNQEHLLSRHFLHYLNNFFFVHEKSEHDFVTQAMNFLESEKRFVEQNALTKRLSLTRLRHEIMSILSLKKYD